MIGSESSAHSFAFLRCFIQAQKAAFSPEATVPVGQAGGAEEGPPHVGFVVPLPLDQRSSSFFFFGPLSCRRSWGLTSRDLSSPLRFQSTASTQISRWIPRASARRSTPPPREGTRTSATCWCRYGGRTLCSLCSSGCILASLVDTVALWSGGRQLGHVRRRPQDAADGGL